MRASSVVMFLLIFLMISSYAFTEKLPTKGTFEGYFFIDRWGQGVFNYFFVSPELSNSLDKLKDNPLRIVATEINQPMNPGGAMILKIESINPLAKPHLQLGLDVSKQVIGYGKQTKLTVVIENNSDKPVSLYRRDLLLAISVNKRGVLPDQKVDRDAIFDVFNNPYFDEKSNLICLRATTYVKLFTDKGEISMVNGHPDLYILKEGGKKRVGIYDEEKRIVSPGKSVSFSYQIGQDWLVNEYELQLKYRPREKTSIEYILSKPLAFDVIVEPEESGQQEDIPDNK